MNKLSSFDRPELIEQLRNNHYDLLIIGGGVTGAGIALDAASRGLKVALVEKNDFASGTSSRSTKLIHGGLRYLKQFEIALVREVGRERATVHRLAPHLVRSEKMLLPIITGGTYGKLLTSLGLMVYDVLAGVEKADQRKMLAKDETLEVEPLLPESRVEGSGLYAEYRTDDARLTIEIIKTAAAYGADSINYFEALEFLDEGGQVAGIKGIDHITGETSNIKAAYVVSAAGPWVDELREIDKSKQGKRLHLTKGVHIVVSHESLPVRQAVYFDTHDGRMIFAIPRGKITYVGTTDTDYHGDKNHVLTNQDDVDYLLEAVNSMFPKVKLTSEDAISSWAGLRPLIHEDGKSASELSRKDEIFESRSGLISIAGGKLTGYRKMAERIVDLVAKKIKKDDDRHFEKCHTDKIVLAGGEFSNAGEVDEYIRQIHEKIKAYGFDEFEANYLVSNYGVQTDEVLERMSNIQEEDHDIRLAKAELEFTLNNEIVFGPLDFFVRRTGRLYFNINSIDKVKPAVLQRFAEAFNWDKTTAAQHEKWLETAMFEASHFETVKV
ncbi:MAG: FAD-dependent oxidoreductase [Bacteroidota bacterium]